MQVRAWTERKDGMDLFPKLKKQEELPTWFFANGINPALTDAQASGHAPVHGAHTATPDSADGRAHGRSGVPAASHAFGPAAGPPVPAVDTAGHATNMSGILGALAGLAVAAAPGAVRSAGPSAAAQSFALGEPGPSHGVSHDTHATPTPTMCNMCGPIYHKCVTTF